MRGVAASGSLGLGTVGQWVLRAMHSQAPRLEDRYAFVPKVMGVANARDGFVYDASGIDPQTVLEFASADGQSLITELDREFDTGRVQRRKGLPRPRPTYSSR